MSALHPYTECLIRSQQCLFCVVRSTRINLRSPVVGKGLVVVAGMTKLVVRPLFRHSVLRNRLIDLGAWAMAGGMIALLVLRAGA